MKTYIMEKATLIRTVVLHGFEKPTYEGGITFIWDINEMSIDKVKQWTIIGLNLPHTFMSLYINLMEHSLMW